MEDDSYKKFVTFLKRNNCYDKFKEEFSDSIIFFIKITLPDFCINGMPQDYVLNAIVLDTDFINWYNLNKKSIPDETTNLQTDVEIVTEEAANEFCEINNSIIDNVKKHNENRVLDYACDDCCFYPCEYTKQYDIKLGIGICGDYTK